MRWTKFTIDTTEEAEDLVSGVLFDEGITNIEIEDLLPVEALEGEEYEELQPDRGEDDGSSRISFYVEEGEDYGALLERIKISLESLRAFVDLGTGHIEISSTDEADWRNKWKDYFHSFQVGDIFIHPSWEELEPGHEKDVVLQIDPGITFGTGKHETTQLCIKALGKYLKGGEKVLDVGCGSGILSMVALKKGAKSVVGTDIDPACVDAVKENLSRNDLPLDAMTCYIGDLTTDKTIQQNVGGDYDVVVANILADIIIGMIDAIASAMKPGTVFISSGIIDFKQTEVEEAFRKAGLTVIETGEQGEWRSVIGRK